MACRSLAPPIGPSVLLPLCGSHHGSGCVPRTLHKWGLHGSILQAAPGKTHPAVGPGVSGPRAAQELGVDSVSVTILSHSPRAQAAAVCAHCFGGIGVKLKRVTELTIKTSNIGLQLQINTTDVVIYLTCILFASWSGLLLGLITNASQ